MIVSFYVPGVKAYVRDVNSPNWIPTVKLGNNKSKEVSKDRYNRSQDRNRMKNSASPATQDEDSVTVTASGSGDNDLTAHPSPSPDTDGFGTFCQTEGHFSSISTEEEKMLRDELNRLTQENRELKEHMNQRNDS